MAPAKRHAALKKAISRQWRNPGLPCAPGCRRGPRRPGTAGRRWAARGIPAANRDPHRGAQALVGAVIGAQGVAVHHQHPLAVQRDDERVGQKPRAGHGAETRPQQEVAVAVHHEAGYAAVGERLERPHRRDLLGVRCVVAHPGLEQVAQDVEGLRPGGLALQEIHEPPGDVRSRRVHVQVRDEERLHANRPDRLKGPSESPARPCSAFGRDPRD